MFVVKNLKIQKKTVIISIVVVVVVIVGIIGGAALNRFYRWHRAPPEGFVPDEKTAIRIAEAIWLPIYGESIYDKQPFVACYDRRTGSWKVTGTLPENVLGSVPEAHIRRIDGKVVLVRH